ncbi:MAG: HEAT repeat domain-containing protein [Candidatus Helarchaeota archaeon]
MTKLAKKIQKFIEKGKIFEAYKEIEKKLESKKTDDYSEDFRLLAQILENLHEDQENIIHDILYYTEKNLTNSDWILRRNALEILKVLARKFPNIFITRKYLSSLKNYAIKDPHWGVRSAAIEVYGTIGDHVPDKVFLLFKERLNDDDADVRMTIIKYLHKFAERNPTMIPEILPLLQKVQKDDPHWEVAKLAGTFVELLSQIEHSSKNSVTTTQNTYLCPFCGKEYSKLLDICLNCGRAYPRCIICKEIIRITINSKIAYCPHCKALAHPEHLQKWVLVNQNCPACLNSLQESEIKFLKKG